MKRCLIDIDIASAAAISAWFGFSLWTVHAVFVDNNVQTYAENGPLENVEACVLAIACIFYLATVLFERKSEKLILLFCSFLCYSFTLRELDVEKFDIPQALIFIGSGIGRNVTEAVALLAMLAYAAFNYSYYWNAAIRFAKSKPGWLLLTGGVFLFVGDFFEKYHGIPHNEYFEELSEFFGFLLILLSSIAANCFMSRMTIRRIGNSTASAQVSPPEPV